jgi:hypothetical protein
VIRSWILDEGREFPSSLSVRIGFDIHLVQTCCFPGGKDVGNVKLITHHQLVPKFRIRGGIPLPLTYPQRGDVPFNLSC